VRPAARAESSRPASAPKSNVISLHGRAATAEKLDLEPAAVSDPFAAPEPAKTPGDDRRDDKGVVVPFGLAAAPAASSSVDAPVTGLVAGDPFASPLAAQAQAAQAPVAPVPAPPARIPVAAWFAIAAALATGVTAGSVLFNKPPPPPTVQIVTVTAPAPLPPTPDDTTSRMAGAVPGTTDAHPDSSAGTVRPTLVPGKPLAVKAGDAAATTGGKVADTTAPLPPSTLGGGPAGPSLLPSTPGPGDPGAGAPAPSGGDPLPSSELQKVVNGGRNALKRACWESALSAKGSGGGSVKVTISFTVGRDGHVSRANATGGDGYPTLAPCIAARVKNWVFPTGYAETSTQASISFVAQ
jgi:hypothetical protein